MSIYTCSKADVEPLTKFDCFSSLSQLHYPTMTATTPSHCGCHICKSAHLKKSTACYIIRRVADAFSSRSHHLIKMPTKIEMENSARRNEARFKLKDIALGTIHI